MAVGHVAQGGDRLVQAERGADVGHDPARGQQVVELGLVAGGVAGRTDVCMAIATAGARAPAARRDSAR